VPPKHLVGLPTERWVGAHIHDCAADAGTRTHAVMGRPGSPTSAQLDLLTSNMVLNNGRVCP
jgi:hypothetical protein